MSKLTLPLQNYLKNKYNIDITYINDNFTYYYFNFFMEEEVNNTLTKIIGTDYPVSTFNTLRSVYNEEVEYLKNEVVPNYMTLTTSQLTFNGDIASFEWELYFSMIEGESDTAFITCSFDIKKAVHNYFINLENDITLINEELTHSTRFGMGFYANGYTQNVKNLVVTTSPEVISYNDNIESCKFLVYSKNISSDTNVTLLKKQEIQTYTITSNCENCTSNDNNPTTINQNEEVTLRFKAKDNYKLNENVIVSNANIKSYNKDKGILILNNASGNVEVIISAYRYRFNITTTCTNCNLENSKDYYYFGENNILKFKTKENYFFNNKSVIIQNASIKNKIINENDITIELEKPTYDIFIEVNAYAKDFNITYDLKNCSIVDYKPSTIKSNETITLKLVSIDNVHFFSYENVKVTNARINSFNEIDGILTISNAIGEVNIMVAAVGLIYDITTNLTNCYADLNNKTKIISSDMVVLKFYADDNFNLYNSSFKVENATYFLDLSNNEIYISNPIDNVVITVTAVKYNNFNILQKYFKNKYNITASLENENNINDIVEYFLSDSAFNSYLSDFTTIDNYNYLAQDFTVLLSRLNDILIYNFTLIEDNLTNIENGTFTYKLKIKYENDNLTNALILNGEITVNKLIYDFSYTLKNGLTLLGDSDCKKTRYGASFFVNSNDENLAVKITPQLDYDIFDILDKKLIITNNLIENINVDIYLKNAIQTYNISTTLNNVSANENNPTLIKSNEEVKLQFTPLDNYKLVNNSFVIKNALIKDFNQKLGLLTIYHAVGNVEITVTSFNTQVTEIILYKNNGENNKIDKSSTLEKVTTLKGTLKENTSITNPVISFYSSTFLDFNYIYIPNFSRYYFVSDITVKSNNYYTMTLKVDVLYSFKDKIKNQYAIIERCNDENYYNKNLKDDIPCDINPLIEIKPMEVASFVVTDYMLSNNIDSFIIGGIELEATEVITNE